MNRVLRMALVAFAMVAALAFVAGCGNEEENDYVDQVNEVQNSFLDEMTAAASQPPPTTPQAANDLISSMQDAIDTAASELEAIDPPEDVADLHQQLVTQMSDLGDQLGNLGKALQSGDPQRAAQAATQLTTALTSAQTEVTTLIDQINTQLEE